MELRDFTSFEKLIAPSVVKIMYWIGIVGICLAGLGAMATAFTMFGGGFLQFIMAIIGTAVALLFWRVACELYIVAFGMFERLGAIRDNLARLPPR
jgi:hypothetical protein